MPILKLLICIENEIMKQNRSLCIFLSSNISVRSFISSGAIKDLNDHFNITYIFPESLNIEIQNGIKIKRKKSGLSISADYFLWYLTFFKFFRKSRNLKEALESFKISMLKKKWKILLTLLSLPIIYEIILAILDKLIVNNNKEIYSYLKKKKPSLVILPGIPFDSFGLEAIKCASRLSIKNIMTVLHWDFFSNKGLLRAKPDIVCVWGKQMFEMATVLHKIPKDKVRIAGVPQFDFYKNVIDISEARKNIDLPIGEKIYLFAGMVVPYDEMSVLSIIDEYITNELHSDSIILYRPHPRKHPRKNEKDFIDYKFKNVILDPENQRRKKITTTELEYYANLLYSIDGLISPFSTMTVEAAICGKPCLVIAFSDNLHAWKLENILKLEHIQPMLNYEWVTLCKSKNDLNDCFKRLVETTCIPDIDKKIRKDIGDIVYMDNDSYSKKMLDIVLDVSR